MDFFKVLPIEGGSPPPERKRLINELVQLDGRISVQYLKDNGEINMFMRIPPEQDIERIRSALNQDKCRLIMETDIPTITDDNIHAFAVSGVQHLAIDLNQSNQLKKVFDFAESMAVILNIEGIRNQEKQRRKLKEAAMGLDKWQSKAWYYSKIGAKATIDFWFDEGSRIREIADDLYRRSQKKKHLPPMTARKLSDKSLFANAQIIFLVATDRPDWVHGKLAAWLFGIQGENKLQAIRVSDFAGITDGIIREDLPTLCLYQLELDKFILLPDQEFERSNQKARVPKALLKDDIAFARSKSGSLLSMIRGNKEEVKDSLSTPLMVVGKQGSGKSTLFVNLALEFFGVRAKDREEWERIGRSVFLFDVADGAMMSEVLAHIPDWLRDRVVILNHADMNRIIPLSWHDLMALYRDDDSIANEVAAIETELLRKFLHDDGQTFSIERFFKSALQASYRVGEGNLLDAIRILKDEEYRKELRQCLKATDFELEIALSQIDDEVEDGGRVIETIENRIAQMRSNKQLFYSLSQMPDERIDFWKWMNEPHLVLIHIPNGRELFQDYAFSHYLAKLWRLMMARERIPKVERRECAVIVDEIDLVIKNKPIQNIFLQITKKPRKYRVKYIFSFHDWSSFARAGALRSEILRSFKTGMDMILLKGSDEVFKNFQAELSPFAVEDFHQLKKYHGIFRITADKKDHVFQARLLEPAAVRLPSFAVPDLDNRFGMTREEIIRRAREILLPLYARNNGKEGWTAKDKILFFLRNSPEGATSEQICKEVGIRRETFSRIWPELPVAKKRVGNTTLYFLRETIPKVV